MSRGIVFPQTAGCKYIYQGQRQCKDTYSRQRSLGKRTRGDASQLIVWESYECTRFDMMLILFKISRKITSKLLDNPENMASILAKIRFDIWSRNNCTTVEESSTGQTGRDPNWCIGIGTRRGWIACDWLPILVFIYGSLQDRCLNEFIDRMGMGISKWKKNHSINKIDWFDWWNHWKKK